MKLDIRAELGWPAAGGTAAPRTSWWDGVDWGAAGRTAAGAGLVVVAGAAAVAWAANPLNLVFGP